jgi:hypothetical protein
MTAQVVGVASAESEVAGVVGGSAKFHHGVARGIVGGQTSQPTTIPLPESYTNPVVVTTVIHLDTLRRWQPAPVVTGVTSTSFDLKVYDGRTAGTYDVNYLVMEAGTYDLGDGLRFEAQVIEAIKPNYARGRGNPGAPVQLGQQYQRPVVVGQVMSDNARLWSAFWACGDTYRDAPGPNVFVGLWGGRRNRPENLGVMVFEAGINSNQEVRIEAGYTDNVVPYKNSGHHTLGFASPTDTVVLGPAGSRVRTRLSWPVFRAADHDSIFPADSMSIAVDGRPNILREKFVVGYVGVADPSAPPPPPPPPPGDITDKAASRFLMQAGFGGDRSAMAAVQELGYEGWIQNQGQLPRSLTHPYMFSIGSKITPRTLVPGAPYFINDRNRFPKAVNFSTPWARNIAYEDDQLRQKVTWALSQIFVVSESSGNLERVGAGLADFYDILNEHAFGSFEALLAAVSLHPVMAHYLTSLNNRKADPINRPGQQPDENYAREVMQLFSIGLWMLNNDGTEQTDGNGDRIPTYDNQDIQELARVFTGIMLPRHKRRRWPIGRPMNIRIDLGSEHESLVLFDEDEHDTGPKTLFHLHPSLETALPAGLTGDADIRNAVSVIAAHPNVGPFMAIRLINSLVKSNPTPAYVDRVASVFNDNGAGVRGDLYAVVKAILLDSEARDGTPDPVNHPDGKFLEPMARIARLFATFPPSKNLEADDPGSMADGGTLMPLPKDEFCFALSRVVGNEIAQLPLHSPSVFNFYLPDYREGNEIFGDLITPEFQLATSASSVNFGNRLQVMILDRYTADVNYDLPDHHVFDFGALADLADDVDALMAEAEVLLAAGELSSDTDQVARALVAKMKQEGKPNYSIALAITNLICMSPDGAAIS